MLGSAILQFFYLTGIFMNMFKYLKSKIPIFFPSIVGLTMSSIASADLRIKSGSEFGVQQMMGNLQSAILNVLAPMICIGGIIYSGTKLAMGEEAGKKMLFWSCIGTVITFSAPSLLSYLQNRVAA